MVGLVLIALGIAVFAWQGVLWVTTSQEVARIGPVEVRQQRQTPIPIAPIVGGVAIAVGLGCLAMGSRERGI
jgi:hypothetical protein